ncbi:hypothetical protein G6O69_37075 [Pseudenhygromyxa sp. WMMC2535]|uniref:hypothetical protein n=1 Tax=Pseudenhygromyxa sp. WMMC2535 TaxID=2712867 RepID=UPI001552E32A|nr:hypothetical protein [Pseudenhygromyxa sp. WMMC2535]NVB41638.1 hypothetical protein [Pseudenhygromyxa sp. WMMC2535]NVB43492.1 hypothetical protein [Pseudenhygromyxa sp. WMMC2535]
MTIKHDIKHPRWLAALTLSLGLGALLPSLFAEAAIPAQTPPDRCAELDAYGYPAYCEPTGPDLAPWWGDEVCCDGADCVEPSLSGCGEREPYYCDYAEVHPDGSLTCMWEAPAFCEVFDCPFEQVELPPEAVPVGWPLCCYGLENCYDSMGGPCGGVLIYCYSAVTWEDGVVECLDASPA